MQTFSPENGSVELAAYYTLRQDAASVDARDIREMLRTRLPGSPQADPQSVPLPGGPRHRALTASAGRSLSATRAVHGAHAPRRGKAVRI